MQGFGRLIRDEKGAVTIEFTVLVPFFILLLVLFADAAMIYLTHSEMYNVARDAARRMATNELKNESEVAAYASERLLLGQRTYTVFTDFGSERQVMVEIPLGEAAIFGVFFRPLLGQSLIASATVRGEPRLLPPS